MRTEPPGFHMPTTGRCRCPDCVELNRNGPVCQACLEPWPCPEAPERREDGDGARRAVSAPQSVCAEAGGE